MSELPLIEARTRPSALELALEIFEKKGRVTGDEIKQLKEYEHGMPREDFC